MNHPYKFPHLACAGRGDMAIFGDLATINIFYKKNGLLHSEQQINCDVTMVLLAQLT